MLACDFDFKIYQIFAKKIAKKILLKKFAQVFHKKFALPCSIFCVSQKRNDSILLIIGPMSLYNSSEPIF